MINPTALIEKAKHSSFYRRVLSFSADLMVPFNRPHHFKVIEISNDHIKVKIPYRKSNFNHIRGLHACALATISEFTTGFLLLSRLDATKYRLIMQRLEMDYFYQGKMDSSAEFTISDTWLQDNILTPLTTLDAVIVICEVKIHDAKGNHLTTGHIHWQIKNWAKVRTRT